MHALRDWSEPPPAAAPGEVQLWLCDLARAIADPALAGLAACLDADESARWRRFLFATDRDRFLASHVFLRTVLALHAGCAPRELRFAKGVHGKPAIASPRVAPAFNLSHSGARALLAVASAGTLGVDIEFRQGGRRFAALARRNFAPSEVDHLATLPDDRREEHFYRVWTLKEAYLKARGTGLSLPLDGFWFDFGAGGELTLDADPAIDPRPAHWRGLAWELPDGYSAALVQEREAGQGAVEPRWFEAHPLQGWRELQVPVGFRTQP